MIIPLEHHGYPGKLTGALPVAEKQIAWTGADRKVGTRGPVGWAPLEVPTMDPAVNAESFTIRRNSRFGAHGYAAHTLRDLNSCEFEKNRGDAGIMKE